MFNVIHLQQERAHKVLLAEDLITKAEKDAGGPRPLTAEECTLFDQLQGDIEGLDRQIAAVLEHQRRREQSAERVKDLERPAGRGTSSDQPANNSARSGGGTSGGGDGPNITASTFRIPATARRTGILKAFKGPDAEFRAYKAGLWARAALFNDYRAAQEALKFGISVDLRNAMGTTSNPDGGFLVPDEMSQAIIDLREEYGVFRRNARVWPMGSDTLLIPRRAGGVTVAAMGENPAAALSSSTPTFDMVQLVAKKCGGLSLISSEIADDAIVDIGDFISNEWAYAFALFEDTLGFTGDGTSTHLGVRGLTTLFTEALALAGAVQVATATHNTFGEIDQTDLAGMMGKLPQYAKIGAKFYCSSVFDEMVFGRLMAVAGGNTVDTLQGTRGRSYLGYPIVISQVLPAGVTTDYNGLAMCFFGDLSKSSSLGDRRQVRIFPSQHRYMDLDQIGILATERIDIVNQDVGTTTTAGPIVALVGSSS